MKKAERLMQIVTYLRSKRRPVTADVLAERFAVSERTIYRDMQDLILSGVPIDGEAGIGYVLSPKHSVPPLMFESDELEALLLGVRMVQGFGDKSLGEAADKALQKIHSVLPDSLHYHVVQQPENMIVPTFFQAECNAYSDEIRMAVKDQRKLQVDYIREDQVRSQRIIWPLGMVYWGKVWTLIAWCEKRDAYRMFRLDRLQGLKVLQDVFETSEACNLQHYLNSQKHI